MHFDKLWCFCVIVVLMNMLTQFNHVENGFTKYTRRNYNDESMAKTIFYNFLLDILYASLVLFFFFTFLQIYTIFQQQKLSYSFLPPANRSSACFASQIILCACL